MLAAGQTQALEEFRDPPLCDVRRDPVQVCEIAQVVQPGEAPVQASLAAEDEADAAPDGVGLPNDIKAEDARLA